MFQNISPEMLARMSWLEKEDQKDRLDGTPRTKRLRQIPPETGRLLAILAANTPDGEIVEIGTSGGYSALWLILACKESGRVVTTFENLEHKARLARETFHVAGVTDQVNLIHGDGLKHLADRDAIAFCFLDAEKELYRDFYEIIVPKLVPGGILVADNVISHAEILETFVDMAIKDARMDGVVVPIGKGLFVCRRTHEV
jgi:predicted O-methyltransferase YrrM